MIGVNVPIRFQLLTIALVDGTFFIWRPFNARAEGIRFYTKLKTATVTWAEDNAGPEFTIPVLS